MVSIRIEDGKKKYEFGIQDFLLSCSIIIGNIGLVLGASESPAIMFTAMGFNLFILHYIIRLLSKLRFLGDVKVEE